MRQDLCSHAEAALKEQAQREQRLEEEAAAARAEAAAAVQATADVRAQLMAQASTVAGRGSEVQLLRLLCAPECVPGLRRLPSALAETGAAERHAVTTGMWRDHQLYAMRKQSFAYVRAMRKHSLCV
jgi:hypothetical protein